MLKRGFPTATLFYGSARRARRRRFTFDLTFLANGRQVECRGEYIHERIESTFVPLPQCVKPPPAPRPPSPTPPCEQGRTSSMCIRELAFTRKTPSDWIQLCKGWREFYASALAAPPGITSSRGGGHRSRVDLSLNKFLTIYLGAGCEFPTVVMTREIYWHISNIMGRANKNETNASAFIQRGKCIGKYEWKC